PIFVLWYNDVSVKRDPLTSDDAVDLPLMEKLNENHTLLKETCGKKKRKVAFTAGPPPVKKARSGGIVISKPSPTTAGKTAAAMKKLITHSGQRDVGPGSDKNVRTRPAPDHFVVLTSGSETLDTDVQTEADTVSPKVTSPIPYVQTEAKAVVAGFVNEIGTSSIPENEAGASSSSLGDGSPIDDFYESQTIDSATAHDIYAYLGNQIDAEFLDCLNVNSAQHVCMMSELLLYVQFRLSKRDVKVATLKSKLKRLEGEAAYVFVLRRRVSELETEAVGRSKELAGCEGLALYGAAISMAINKEMQKGLEAGVEHGKASRSLSELEAYESGIAAEYVAAFNELEKVSFSLLDQLEVLKDSPLERLTSRGPDSISHEILLFDAIAASHNHAEKSASTTSYGPSHLGPSFPPSFQWLASLLRYTKSPGLKVILQTLAL
ncbi:hypothetical protein Tco_1349467, partial [Tanacetum coccineum]